MGRLEITGYQRKLEKDGGLCGLAKKVEGGLMGASHHRISIFVVRRNKGRRGQLGVEKWQSSKGFKKS